MLYILLISSLIFPELSINRVVYRTWYARILDTGIYFYLNPNEETDSRYFEIETGYFVRLISDYNNLYYRAEYMDIEGYVKKDEVQVVTGTPKTPYLRGINFRVFSESSEQMRTLPNLSKNSNIIAKLPQYADNIEYIGKIRGESAVIDRTDVWYFCRYHADRDYFGYIYSDGCDKLSTIPKNTEEYEYIDAPDFSETIGSPSLLDSSSKSYKLIIILVSIPVGLFVLMLIKSNIILRSKKKEKAKEIKLFFDS